MAGIYGEIDSRQDFLRVLDEATQGARRLRAASPGDATLESILKQLEALGRWTECGGQPNEEERESIDIAVRAAREFEGNDELFAWTRKLYSIDAYVDDWPTDDEARSATDEDFFDGDD